MIPSGDRCARLCSLLLAVSFASPGLAADDPAAAQRRLLGQALGSIPSAAPADRTLAPYFFVHGQDDGVDRLPVRGVEAEVDIAGVIAQVRLVQTYVNDGQETLEAIYLFPASTRAAVHAMRMTIGERVIEARLRERAKARKEYDQAKQAGQTASLLEQQRPNVFQMSVANILPGDEIRVELEYTELLVPTDGQYEFVLPSVVGPRYSNQPAAGAPTSQRWVENPYLKAGQAPTCAWDLKLDLHAGLPIAKLTSPSHPLKVDFTGQRTARLELGDDPTAGNRDLILRYRLAGDAIQHGMLLSEGEAGNYFLVMAQPPARPERSDLVAREYLFILDVSGSMHGYPLDTSKQVVRELLNDLRSYDYFNVLLFAGGSAVLADKPMAATRANVRRAREFIDLAQGGGGTELLPALERALAMPRAQGVSRSVVLLTDGYVSVEREAFELIRKRRADANLFAFGIGSSVNRFLIEGLARAGFGEPFVVTGPDEAEEKARRFREYIRAPVLSDVQIAFEGFEAFDVEPMGVPDLFAQRPVIVFGKYKGKATGRVRISGVAASGPVDLDLDVAQADRTEANGALRFLWARHRIRELDDLAQFGQDEDIEREVTRLGLAHGLLTRFTSFVAVDPQARGKGDSTTVEQPLPMPAGVSNYAVGSMGVLGVIGTTGRGGGSASGFGSLGLSGAASGYAGSGHAGLGAPRAKGGVRVRASAMMVTGSLDKGVIKRVIRRNNRRFKALYERQLKADPNLSGKVVVKLVIGADGLVKKAEITRSTMKAPDFERALLKILKTLKFPKPPGGGEIVLNHPFIFRSAP